MADSYAPTDDLGGERDFVQRQLEQRFPDVDATVVTREIDEAAMVTAGAKIETYRAVLAERRASNQLRRLRLTV
jgi:hypothetical protein